MSNMRKLRRRLLRWDRYAAKTGHHLHHRTVTVTDWQEAEA